MTTAPELAPALVLEALMSTNSSYTLFVGVDIAAASATVAWVLPPAKVSRAVTIAQTPKGFDQLQQMLMSLGAPPAQTLIVMEATGSYWMRLATALTQTGFAVSVINPAQAHHFAKALLKRSKTDVIDAQTLAQLAATLQPNCWQPPPNIYYELYQRLVQRDALLALRQQVRNQQQALLQMPVVIAEVLERMDALLATFSEQLQQVEAELTKMLNHDQAWAQSAQRLLSIQGIGLVTAAWLLVSTLNFSTCKDAQAATAYAGLAPRAHQSGTSVWGRPSIGHVGNGRLRTALYMATLSAARINPVIKEFYERLRAKGKPMKVARCAAARKLMHIAWAVVKKGQDFAPNFGKNLVSA